METEYVKIAVGEDKPVCLILNNGKVVNVQDGLSEVKWLGMTKEQIKKLVCDNKWAAVFIECKEYYSYPLAD